MKNVALFFIRRPILVNFILVLNFVFGGYFIYKVPKEAFPGVSLNQINITTKYPGASSKDVELNVTSRIEDKIAEIGNIKEYRSSSIESISRLTVFADDDLNAEQFKDLLADVQSEVDKIDDFPADLEGAPIITSVTTEDRPIMEVAFTGEYDQLKNILPQIESDLRKVSGVSTVTTVGLPDEEIHIEVNAQAAIEKEVDLNTIYYAINSRNQVGTGGTLESFIAQKKVVSFNKYQKAEDVLETVLRMSPDGHGLYLKDVADIVYTPKDDKLTVRNNGLRGATILVAIRGGIDQLKVSDKIKNVLKHQELPVGVSYILNNDVSDNARAKFALLKNNGLIGFVLVLMLLFYFLGGKTAFWTAFGIPFTVFGSMILFVPLGMSLNSVSMGAFVIVLGMIVDDAMVISERFDANIELGQSPEEAASNAVGRLWKPVLAASLTTITAFMPLMALGGMPGKFIWQMPAVVMIALFVSLIDCYLLLPSHLAHGPKKTHHYKKNKIVQLWENMYEKVLSKVLDFRYAVVLAFLSIFLFSVYIGKTKVRKDSFPQEASEGFTIKATLKKGAAPDEVEKIIHDIELALAQLKKNELKGFTARLGTHSISSLTSFGTEENLVTFLIYLTSFGERDRTALEIVDSLKSDVGAKFDQAGYKLEFNLMRLGPPLGEPFEIIVTSNSNDNRKVSSDKVISFLKGIDGLYDVKDDYIPGKDEINLQLNYKKVAQAGLTPVDIIRTLRIAFDGQVVTDYSSINKSYDFRLRLDRNSRGNLDFISKLPIANKRGQLIKLSTMIDYDERPSAAEIKHYNGVRSTSVTGNINTSKITAVKMLSVFKEKFVKDKNVKYTISGRPVEEEKIFSGLLFAAALAMIGIYFILSLMFNSYAMPILILSVIPFGVVGIFISFYFHHLPISMFAGIGLIGLAGIVVNDSIVLVDHISELMKENGSFSKDLLIRGARERLRPISLTTVSTILAVAPTAYAIGGYDPLLSPLSLAILYGLLFGTTVVLLFIPTLYAIGNDITAKMSKGKGGDKTIATAAMLIILLTAGYSKSSQADNLVGIIEIIGHLDKSDEFKLQQENNNQADYADELVDGMLDGKLTSKIYKYSFENYPNPPITLDSKKEGTGASFNYDKLTAYGFKFGLGIEFEDKELGTIPTNKQFSLDAIDSIYKASVVIPLWRNLGSKEYHLRKKSSAINKLNVQSKVTAEKAKLIGKSITLYWTIARMTMEKDIAKASLARFVSLHQLNVIKRKSGIISRAELLTSEVEITNRRRKLQSLVSNINIEMIKLKSLLEIKQQNTLQFKPEKMLLGQKFKSLVEKDIQALILKGASYNILKANRSLSNNNFLLEAEVAKSKVDLFVSLKSIGRGDDYSNAIAENNQSKYEAYAGISWSFDTGTHKTSSQLARATGIKRQAELKQKQTVSKLNDLFREIKQRIIANDEQIKFLENIKSQQKSILKAEKKRFQNGKITTLDYVKLQEAYDGSLLQVINLNFASEMNVLNYFVVIGLLDEYLKPYNKIAAALH